MDRFLRITTLWLWGGALYYLIETLWRGYSHDAMFAVGGLCFLLIGGMNNYLPWRMGFLWQCLIGAAAVTVVEFVAGCVLNLWLNLNIWDYSDMPLNLFGQVCLWYSLAWIALSAVGIYFDDYLRWKLYGETKPHYYFI